MMSITSEDPERADGTILVRHLGKSRERERLRVPVLETPVLHKPEVVVPSANDRQKKTERVEHAETNTIARTHEMFDRFC